MSLVFLILRHAIKNDIYNSTFYFIFVDVRKTFTNFFFEAEFRSCYPG